MYQAHNISTKNAAEKKSRYDLFLIIGLLLFFLKKNETTECGTSFNLNGKEKCL